MTVRSLIAASVGLTSTTAEQVFADTLTAARNHHGDTHVNHRLTAIRAATRTAFTTAGITTTPADLEHAVHAVYFGIHLVDDTPSVMQDMPPEELIRLAAEAVVGYIADPPEPRTRSVRGADLTEGDVLWLWFRRGGWRVDRFEPYRGVNVDNGTFPPTTRIAFMTNQGDHLEMTIHPQGSYELLVTS